MDIKQVFDATDATDATTPQLETVEYYHIRLHILSSNSMPHAVFPHVSVVPPMGMGAMPQQFQPHQQPMSNFPAEIMRRPPPLGRRSPPRGSGGQAYSRY